MAEAGRHIEPGPAPRRANRSIGTRKVPRAVREPQMLETAGRIFAARGFHEASMDEIAEAAGISKPMLYSYFGSKEGLYFAFVNLSYRDVIAAIDSAVAEATTPECRPEAPLLAGVRAYFRYVSEHQDAFRVLFREMGDPGDQLEQQRRRLHRRVAAAVEVILRQHDAPPARLAMVDALTEAFLGSARALADWWLDHSQLPADEIAELQMDLMLRGLIGHP